MYLLIKPASGACNLRCRYCFYADEMNNRSDAVRKMMSAADAETIIQKALARAASFRDPRARTLSLGFQGGEPMLAGLDFFRAVTETVRKYNNRQNPVPVSYFLQTNGTLIREEWARFFAENHFLVGISLDGTEQLHDQNRVLPDGSGTHALITEKLGLLKEAGADFNILTVLTGENARNGAKIYNYYRRAGYAWQQYIPCLAPLGGAETEWSLTAEQYGGFLCRVFDLWYDDVTAGRQVYNREFENWIGILAGIAPEDCGMSGVCSEQYLIESDGSVYPCDFYALDPFLLGNLLDADTDFAGIDRRREQIGFISASAKLPGDCQKCRWLPLCRNGCRRNRLPTGEKTAAAGMEKSTGCGGNCAECTAGTCAGDAPDGKNRFCAAYRRFFPYALPRMEQLARMVRK